MFDRHSKKKTDESGFVLVGALLILLLLVLIGVSASTSSFLELQIASSHKARAIGFYAAESGLSYLTASPELYGSANVVEDSGLRFPSGAPSETPEDPATRQVIGVNADQTFQGTVTYDGADVLPPGSGFSSEYVAHYYSIESNGYGPNGAETTLEVSAYRIGF